MGTPRLEIRPLRPNEAGLVVRYFHDASDADLDRMGVVDRTAFPAPDDWRRRLEASLATPADQATSFYLAWLVDGKAIGHASIKDIAFGDHAAIHLHMWSTSHRGHGLGARLFCRSVLEAYDRFRLRSLVCEPSAGNAMPNRMLAKVGFPLERTYVGASSELSRVTTLNRYRIERAVAAAYLERQA